MSGTPGWNLKERRVLKSCRHEALMWTVTPEQYHELSDEEQILVLVTEITFKNEPCSACKASELTY